MPPTIAYLARGKLHVCRAGKEPEEIESTFGRQFAERQMREIEQHGWKGRSGVWGSMGMAPPSMEQWRQAGGPTLQQARTVALARGAEPEQIVYALDMGNVGGLFSYSLAQGYERRLMHKDGFLPRALAVHPQTKMFALALDRGHGADGLATSEQEGRYLSGLLTGDCTNACPAWRIDKPRLLLFQSAPIGRSEHGVPLGLGPYAIREVDLDSGNVATIIESKEFDYLLPRYDGSGNLWFIRRPYEAAGPKPVKLTDALLDFVLFPYRFFRALFYFFNFFSMMFSGSPLATSAGQREMNEMERVNYTLWGQMIDTKKVLSQRRRGQQAGIVPKTWQLVRRDKEGREEVIAANVAAFDLAPAGGVVFTDGFAVQFRAEDGTVSKLCSDELVETIVVLMEAA